MKKNGAGFATAVTVGVLFLFGAGSAGAKDINAGTEQALNSILEGRLNATVSWAAPPDPDSPGTLTLTLGPTVGVNVRIVVASADVASRDTDTPFIAFIGGPNEGAIGGPLECTIGGPQEDGSIGGPNECVFTADVDSRYLTCGTR